MSNNSIYQNELYYMYLSIEDRSYNEKIRFVERNLDSIDSLNPEVRAEILCNYIIALSEMERYEPIIPIAQNVLELIIECNIEAIGEINIYNEILYYKGIAHIELMQFDEARNVFYALLRMDEGNSKYVKALFSINRREGKKEKQTQLAISIGLVLLTGLLLMVELLLIRVFYAEHSNMIEWLRNLSFLSAIGLMIYMKVSEIQTDRQSLTLIQKKRD